MKNQIEEIKKAVKEKKRLLKLRKDIVHKEEYHFIQGQIEMCDVCLEIIAYATAIPA